MVGTVGGRVQVYINQGTDDVPVFDSFPSANSYNLQVGGTEFRLNGQNSRTAPRVFDWNEDGLKDLLVGEWGGRIYFLENVGTNAVPVFDSAEEFLLATGDSISFGMARLYVTDWNNDGLNDVVVGNSGGYVMLFKATSAALLTVNAVPAGFGQVTKAPDKQTYLFEDVTLTAIFDPGYTFIGWTGCDSPSVEQCVMNMEDTDKTVTALFSLPTVETSVTFGTVDAGTTPTRTLTITNDGITDLYIDDMDNVQTLALPFSVTDDTCGFPVTLSPGAGCEVTVEFSPTAPGSFTDTFNISSNSVDVSVTGTAVTGSGGPDIDVDPVDVSGDFLNDEQPSLSPQEVITVTNVGIAPLGSLSVSSAPSAPFSIAGNDCPVSPDTLAVDDSCYITVEFNPLAGGVYTDSLTISSDDPNEGSVNVSLLGSAETVVGNNPPTEPILVSPPNGASNVSAADFRWTSAVDFDGDPLIHRRYIDTDPSFSNPQIFGTVESERNISYAMVFGNPIFIAAMFGIVALGIFLKRRKIAIVIAAVVFILGLLLVSCGGSKDMGEGEGLAVVQPGQTYYWKVAADDGKGGITESDTWSLTSAPK